MKFFNWLFTASKDMPITTGAEGRKFVPVTADPYAHFTKEDWSSAALDIVFKMGLRTDPAKWGGTVTSCANALARIEKERIHFHDQQPPKLRAAIMDWLDHYADRARENMRDCETKASILERNKSDAKYEARMARERHVRDVLRKTGALP